MKIVRSLLVLSLSVVGLVACASAEDDGTPPPPVLGAQYGTKDASAPFSFVEFEEGGRYLAMPMHIGAALERGTYELHGSEMIFVDDATHTRRSMGYSAAAAASVGTSSIRAAEQPGLTNGSQQLVSGGQDGLVSRDVKLVDKQYALVTCGGGAGICSFIGCSGRITLGAPGPGECLGGASSCCSIKPAAG